MTDVLPEKIGKYRIERLLGRGASGCVYLAQDPFRQTPVAIKLAHPELLRDKVNGARYRHLLMNEANLVGKLNHPHIVQVLDAETDGDLNYLVMEYVPGGTLEPYTDAAHLLPVDRVVEIMFKCCTALDYAFRNGLIHRDLKPANIMLPGETDIKITDFGAAFALNAETTQVIGMIGSPAYMSPEQVQERTLTHHTDIFSLGVVFYRLLTGHLPFEADNYMTLIYKINMEDPPPMSTYRPDLPEMLETIVRRALQKEREARYNTWMEFAADIAHAFKHLPAPEDNISDTEKFNALRVLEFFHNFTDSQLWEVMRIGAWKRIHLGTTLIHEGRIGNSFYILTQGRVGVYKNEVLLSNLEPGSCFGEMSYLNPAKPVRTASVRALENGLILKIRAESLEKASESLQSRFDKQFIRILIERLTRTNSLLAQTTNQL